MQTLHASSVLRKAWSLWTGLPWDQTAPAGVDFSNLRLWFESRVKDAWIYQFWPDLTRYEKRYFAEIWATEKPWVTDQGYFVLDDNGDQIYLTRTYQEEEFVYYIPTAKYYIALQENSAEIPYDNPTYWAEAARSYEAPDWLPSTSYAVGDRVYSTDRDEFFQCHTAHVSASTFASANWGKLLPLHRKVVRDTVGQTKLGTIIALYDKDPRLHGDAQTIDQWMVENAVNTVKDVDFVWVEFRIRAPALNGNVYNSATTYTIGQQVYYTKSDGYGDFFVCVNEAAPTENPEDFAIHWQVVEIPHYFEEFLGHAVYASALLADGQTEKGQSEEAAAYARLNDSAWELLMQEKQLRRPNVWTR